MILVELMSYRVIYFPANWGAKEPQNLPKHRVVIVIHLQHFKSCLVVGLQVAHLPPHFLVVLPLATGWFVLPATGANQWRPTSPDAIKPNGTWEETKQNAWCLWQKNKGYGKMVKLQVILRHVRYQHATKKTSPQFVVRIANYKMLGCSA